MTFKVKPTRYLGLSGWLQKGDKPVNLTLCLYYHCIQVGSRKSQRLTIPNSISNEHHKVLYDYIHNTVEIKKLSNLKSASIFI